MIKTSITKITALILLVASCCIFLASGSGTALFGYALAACFCQCQMNLCANLNVGRRAREAAYS